MSDGAVAQNPPTSNDGGGSNSKLAHIGVAAATAASGGFAFGLFEQLGIAKMVGDHTAYSIGVLCFVVALILVTGRATISMTSDARKAVDRMTVFSALIAAISLGFFFTQPREVNVYARFVPELVTNIDPPKLVPRLINGHGTAWDLAEEAKSIRVASDGLVEIDIRNLGPLLSAYHQSIEQQKQARTQYEIVAKGAQVTPPPPPP